MGKNKPRGPQKTSAVKMDLPKSVVPNTPREFKKRTLEEEKAFLTKISPTLCKIDIGFVPGMRVPAYVIVNDELEELLLDELAKSAPSSKGCCSSQEQQQGGGFLPALKQVANVAALPGIVKGSYGKGSSCRSFFGVRGFDALAATRSPRNFFTVWCLTVFHY